MNLIFNSTFDDVKLLLDIRGEAVKLCLCIVEERHFGGVVRGKSWG